MATKLTTDEFIKKAKMIHKNQYDYSESHYKNALTKIKTKCLTHGYFEQVAGSHLSGHGCYKCGRKKVSKFMLLSLDKFIKTAKKIHNNLYNYSKVIYLNNKKNKLKL